MRSNEEIRKNCEYCGKEFLAAKLTTRYCCHDCNSRAYKEQQRKKVLKTTQALITQERKEKDILPLKDREYLKIPEVARLLGISRWCVYRLVCSKTLPAIQLTRRTTLINKDELKKVLTTFQGHYQVMKIKPHLSLEEWYTYEDIIEKYGLKRHRIRQIVNSENIQEKKDGHRTMFARGDIDRYFVQHGFNKAILSLSEWWTIEEVQEHLNSSSIQGARCWLSKYSIPRKKIDGKSHYSSYHIKQLKQNAV